MTHQQIDEAAEVIVARCQAKPLPFIVPDPDNPLGALSVWTVTETGDDCFDYVAGVTYAEDLLQRMKALSTQFGGTGVVLEHVAYVAGLPPCVGHGMARVGHL